ncbi:hypothetical protein ACJ73_00060 [Blastomyces percursus]|uniref:Mitochondrial thiamine pyrophosphate carrier 1 n=1 Tax=Blastomyces percursus TaxID=1658174 RepID=A0A1J9RLR1_9EURO|nr:hypothetical protein ACJ73_00060 [Blastomyces percursus]
MNILDRSNSPTPPTLSSGSDGRLGQASLDAMASWTHLVAGASGGMATALLTSPLDVLRTRLQSDLYSSPSKTPRLPTISTHSQSLLFLSRSAVLHFRETFEILRSTHRLEGWRSLFKGLGPSLTGVVPATAIKFYTYGNCKQFLPGVLQCDKDVTLVHILSAASAGIVTGTATNPIWVIKTRLQLDRSRSSGAAQYSNSVDCARQILRNEGLRGLYRGLGASYLGVIETTLHLTAYERMKDTLTSRGWLPDHLAENEAVQGVILSGAAGISKLVAVLIAYPHESKNTGYKDKTAPGPIARWATEVHRCDTMPAYDVERGRSSNYGLMSWFLGHLEPSNGDLMYNNFIRQSGFWRKFRYDKGGSYAYRYITQKPTYTVSKYVVRILGQSNMDHRQLLGRQAPSADDNRGELDISSTSDPSDDSDEDYSASSDDGDLVKKLAKRRKLSSRAFRAGVRLCPKASGPPQGFFDGRHAWHG